MFKTRKTKILSAPAEEILEVKEPEIIEEEIPEPEIVTVSNIQYIAIIQDGEDTASGKLTDGNGAEYLYVWDKKLKRIAELSGLRVDSLTWELCDSILRKYYVKPEPPKVEEPIETKIAEVLKVALTPILSSIKALETKVSAPVQRMAPAPVQSAPRPQVVTAAPVSAPAKPDAYDSDISVNALKFLQESSNTPDLGIDYMSL